MGIDISKCATQIREEVFDKKLLPRLSVTCEDFDPERMELTVSPSKGMVLVEYLYPVSGVSIKSPLIVEVPPSMCLKGIQLGIKNSHPFKMGVRLELSVLDDKHLEYFKVLTIVSTKIAEALGVEPEQLPINEFNQILLQFEGNTCMLEGEGIFSNKLCTAYTKVGPARLSGNNLLLDVTIVTLVVGR